MILLLIIYIAIKTSKNIKNVTIIKNFIEEIFKNSFSQYKKAIKSL